MDNEANRLRRLKQRIINERARRAFAHDPASADVHDVEWLCCFNAVWRAFHADGSTIEAGIVDIEKHLVARFIQVELLVGVLGGFSAAAPFFIFAWSSAPFRLALYLVVVAIGVLVGLEIPLIMRLLKRDLVFKDLVSQVLTFDYLGALAVSILFPVLLVPHLGLMRAACCSVCSTSRWRSGRAGCFASNCRTPAGCACRAVCRCWRCSRHLPRRAN